MKQRLIITLLAVIGFSIMTSAIAITPQIDRIPAGVLTPANPTIVMPPIDPIAADKAFQFSATAKNNKTIIATWNIAPGYYLYQNKIHFKVMQSSTTRLGQPKLPPSTTRTYPGIGTFEVYGGIIQVEIPIIRTDNGHLILQATYQGCSEAGYCYPPTRKIVPLNLTGDYLKPVTGISVDVPHTKATPINNEQSKIESLLSGKSLWTILIGFLGFGLLISLTPCVLPMIPILSSIIVGRKKITTGHSFALSLVYVLGMAVTYAIAGIIFGFLGGSVQAIFQQPWIIILFSAIFVLLALSLFGFYNIQLPEKIRGSLAHASKHQKHGTYIGTFLMGSLSSLILSPCVTPPLVGVLGYISQTGNAWLGGIALFTMGIGMGAPLLVVGASGAKILPKAGAWMNATKSIMGILMLAMAIYMLSRILSPEVVMLLWAALAIGSAVYMGAFSSSKTTLKKLYKGLGIIVFIYGIFLIIGASNNNTNPLKPLNFINQAKHSNPHLQFTTVKTVADVSRALKQAAQENKPVMLDFYADWCVACKEMDAFAFSDPMVKKHLKSFVLLRADVTNNDLDDKTLERHYNVIAPPTILFFNRSGQELKAQRIIGEKSAKIFLKHLQQLPISSR